HRDIHGRTALCRRDQRLLQFDADLVFEEDEGLEQDFLLGLSNGLEHTRKEFLAVFQQLKTISVSPVKLHRCNSTASGRGSDRCVQGLLPRICGRWLVALRT